MEIRSLNRSNVSRLSKKIGATIVKDYQSSTFPKQRSYSVIRKEKLKIGVIGCGNIASIQLPYIKKYVDEDSIALCDKNDIRLRWTSEKFNVRRSYSDIELLIDHFEPDVVHILTPPRIHRDMAVYCLKRNRNLFIEKPMCISVDGAKEILEESKRRNLSICIDHLRLFDPLVIKTRNLLTSGEYGELLSISTSETNNYFERKTQGIANTWLSDLPGEIIYDILPHHISLIDSFLQNLSLCQVSYQKDKKDNLTDIQCIFSSKDNQKGTLQISLRKTFAQRNEILIECTNGYIYIDFTSRIIINIKRKGLPFRIQESINNVSIGRQYIKSAITTPLFYLYGKTGYIGMDNTIRKFYRSILKGYGSPISVESGYRVVRLVNDIYNHIGINLRDFFQTTRIETSGMSGADILVTGGTGFIGRNLVQRLSKGDDKVRILTHREINLSEDAYKYNNNVEIVFGDINNPEVVRNAVRGIRTIFHLAAATTQKNPYYHLDTTISGTQNILNIAIESGVKNFIYLSTIALLSARKYSRKVINEDFPYEENPRRRDYYTYAKLEAEKIARTAMQKNKGTVITILRPGLVYGEGKNPLSSLAIKTGKRLCIVLGSGKKILPLVYVENLIDAILLAENKKKGSLYNVIDDEIINVKAFMKLYKSMAKTGIITIYIYEVALLIISYVIDKIFSLLLKKHTDYHYKATCMTRSAIHSNEKIKLELGWEQKTTFQDALGKVIDTAAS